MRSFKAVAACAVLAAALVPRPGICQDKSADSEFDKLTKTLASIAGGAPGGSRAGISVVDVMSGQEIFSKSGDELHNPASNAKIITASCALKRLGPDFRFVTSFHGRQDGSVIRGPIYIKGHADPTLATKDLLEMVRELVAAGVRRVEGGVVVDDTYFDGENMPFAFDQQSDEDADFRSPIGAVSLNHNALSITIRPGLQGMSPAIVFLDPPEYATLINDTVTMAQGAHNPKISSTGIDDKTKIRVWGQIPLGSRAVTYFRRIDNPSLFSGFGVKSALESLGIAVGGSVQTGPLPPGVPKLAEHVSQPLAQVLFEAGKVSNNFVTETVLKTMGAEVGKGPGTWEKSVEAVSETLAAWGLQKDSYVFRNGSGLFDANKFSARQFTKVLRAVYMDAAIRPEFLSQLAIGGVDGTIGSRYQGGSVRGLVRAKTGTLADVSTLSGYVFDAAGNRPIAFSILVDNAAGYVSSARSYQEKIVTAIADYLNP